MDEEKTSTAVARVEAHPAALMLDDEEIRLTYRVAEALYLSGAWKIKNAEAAFAKIVVGRDLGLSPAQAMQGIHIVEGGIQMHYAQLGQFVRAREGYDYRAGWLKEAPLVDVLSAERPPELWTDEEKAAVVSGETRLVAVAFEDEEITDLRPIVGAFVEFLVDGERRGVSRFTLDDARSANLIKSKGAWETSPRNMLLARAMSNGAKWFVPEVFAGMPVYTDGEIPERKALDVSAATGDGGDEGRGIELGPKVEEIIARAKRLGHGGLSNRGAVELAVGNRAPGVINDWVKRARAELDRFEASKTAPGANAAGTIDVEERPVEEPEEEVTAEPVEEPVPEDPEIVVLRDRLRRLNRMADDPAAAPDDLDQLLAEIDVVEGKLREKGVEPEERST